ncbi:MAG TPA: SBBP repeat-containing protein, partial [Chitinophagaceae bacterium]|nr:SBBP repeat-containing protein [Chitinophagaceae bacterium]
MKKIVNTFLALMFGIATSAQYTLIQQVNPGPNAWVDYNHIAPDQQGNLIFSGRIYNTSVTFGSTTLTAGTTSKCFMAKMDAGNNWLWARTLGGGTGVIGSIGNITTDNNGNIYLTGWFEGNVLFDNISLTSVGSSNTSWQDLFVAKMNGSGNFVWAKKEGTKNGSDQGYGIALDGSGSVYVTGHMTRKTIQDRIATTMGEITDIYLVKYNNSGAKLWEKKYTNGVTGSSGLSNGDGRDLFGRRVIADASGNIYFTGGFYGTVSFGNGSGLTVSANKRSAFLAKLNSSGTAEWVRTAIGNGNGGGADQGCSLFIDNANNVFWGGIYWGTSSVIGNITLSGQHNFLARHSSTGTLAWAVNIPNNDYYNSIGGIDVKIFRGSSNSISVVSQSYGFLEISPTSGSIITQDSFTGWNTTGNAGISDVAATPSGHIFSGKVLGTVGLGNMTLSTGCEPYDSCFNDGFEHAFIATYTPGALRKTNPVTAKEFVQTAIKVYPNP